MNLHDGRPQRTFLYQDLLPDPDKDTTPEIQSVVELPFQISGIQRHSGYP